MDRDVPNELLNGVHMVVGSHMEYPDYLSEDGGEVLKTACGEEISQWAFVWEPQVHSGTLQEAKKTGVRLCLRCFNVTG